MEISQCIFCDTIYFIDDSDSDKPNSLCSKDHEEWYKKYHDDFELLD